MVIQNSGTLPETNSLPLEIGPQKEIFPSK